MWYTGGNKLYTKDFGYYAENRSCLSALPLRPVPPPLRGGPGCRSRGLLRRGPHPESRPRCPAFLGGALHQRHPWQRHRVLFRLHPQVLLLPELPHQRRRAGQGDQRGASGRNLSQPAGTGSPQHQSGHAGPVAALDHCRIGPCPGTGPASAHCVQHRRL